MRIAPWNGLADLFAIHLEQICSWHSPDHQILVRQYGYPDIFAYNDGASDRFILLPKISITLVDHLVLPQNVIVVDFIVSIQIHKLKIAFYHWTIVTPDQTVDQFGLFLLYLSIFLEIVQIELVMHFLKA